MRSRTSAIRLFTVPLLSLAAAAAIAGAGCAATDDDPITAGTDSTNGTTAPVGPASSGSSVKARSSIAQGLGTGTDPAQFTGRIERTYYDDFHNNTFRTEYHLRFADGSRVKLDFAGKTPPLLPLRQQVQLRATHVNGRLLVETAPTAITSSGDGETVANQGDPGIAPLGAQKYAVVMVKYTDDPNTPYTQDDLRTMIFTGATSVTHYVQENSYGKSTMVGINRWDGDIYGWISVPHIDCGGVPCDCMTHMAAADAQLASANLGAYDNISYIVPGMGDICGFSGFAADDRINVVQWVDPYIIAHELGHNFGAPHSQAYTCYDAGNVRLPLAPDSQCISDQEYGDLHDVMGLGLRHMHAYNKMRLGYLAPANQSTWAADGDYVLGPIERHQTGLQSLRLPRPSSTYFEGSHLYLEFRQPIGMFDTVFPPTHPVFNGITLRLAADAAVMGPHSHILDTQLDTPEPTYGNEDATLQLGQAFYEPMDHYTVQPLSVSAASASVRVLGNRNPMKINFQPAAAPVPAGYLVDSGAVYGNRGNGFSYGWSASNANAVDLNSAETPGLDQRYDTFNKLQGGGSSTWELGVANGSYLVRVAAGDVSTNAVYKIMAEGVLVLDKTPVDGEKWFTRSAVVTVNDGRLTVTNGAGASNNKINFIEVISLAQASQVFTANFNSTSDSFTYADNSFRGATQGSYANGVRQATGGVGNTGNLQVTLGGINDNDILGMSGGWSRSFSLTTPSSGAVTFSYNLTQTAEYENDEYSEVLVSIDGRLVGIGLNDYVARVFGDGPGGAPVTTGWKTVTVNLGMLGSGSHTVTIGGYNNKKTDANESTDLRIDDVTVRKN